MSGAHTPGPWLRIDTADYAEIHAAFRPSSPAVAIVGKATDADLITASPDLLAAGEALVAEAKLGKGVSAASLNAMLAAIARARGEA